MEKLRGARNVNRASELLVRVKIQPDQTSASEQIYEGIFIKHSTPYKKNRQLSSSLTKSIKFDKCQAFMSSSEYLLCQFWLYFYSCCLCIIAVLYSYLLFPIKRHDIFRDLLPSFMLKRVDAKSRQHVANFFVSEHSEKLNKGSSIQCMRKVVRKTIILTP